MKKNIVQKMIFGAVLLTLAACTQDELTDGNGNSLPEGKYPLEISSVTMSAEIDEQPWGVSYTPQTRVSENNENSSKWDGNEEITVELDGKSTKYRINTDNSLTLLGDQLYWKSAKEAIVTAWYPTYDKAPGKVALSDQSKGLAYVLQATKNNASYKNSVELKFDHQLAKVRISLSGSDKAKVNNIKIWSFTECTHTKGSVSPVDDSEGWITMKIIQSGSEKYWEANVVPGEIIKMEIHTDKMILPTSLKKTITLNKGTVNYITLTVGN